MASSYVNDLRLNEMATGDASGTWGTVTNTNLELIGEALGFGTEAITTNADTHTSTVADGATDPARAMYIKYTGTLDSACTITIAPNTLNRLHFIENGTSGSQNIIISQGSGANITIPPGDTKAVYLDGAGSGAAVVDAFASLNVVDLKVQDDLTVNDDILLNSDSAVISFGADADTTLTHTDGSGLTLNGTNKLMFNDASQFIQGASATVLDIAATDEIELTATLIDVVGNQTVSGTLGVTGIATFTDDIIIGDGKTIGSASDVDAMTIASNGQVTFTQTLIGTALDISGNIDVDGTTNLDVVDIDGAVDMASTLQVDGAITSSTGASITTDGNTAQLTLTSTDADAGRGAMLDLVRNSASPADNDLCGTIRGLAKNDAGQDVVLSEIIFRNEDVTDGTEDGQIIINCIRAGAAAGVMKMASSETIMNYDEVDLDFRVASNNNSNMLFVDGGNDIVAIGKSGSHTVGGFKNTLQIDGTGATTSSISVVRNTNDSNPAYMQFGKSRGTSVGSNTIVQDDDEIAQITFNAADGTNRDTPAASIRCAVDGTPGENDMPGRLTFHTTADGASSSTERMRIDSSGNLYLGVTSASGGNDRFYVHDFEAYFGRDTGTVVNMNRGDTGVILDFRRANSSVGTISTNANSLPSDRNFKKDITDLTLGLDFVNDLKPSKYKYKADLDDSPLMYGLIAQDLESSLEKAGVEKNSAWVLQHNPKEDEKESDYSLDYLKLTPILIKAIQELKAENTALANRITALESA